MDRVFFELKRAHHATLKFGRVVLGEFGLTPARFDLLYALTERGVENTQMGLRRALGVARSTISEMLAALERIGLIARTRARDRRTWVVALTTKGREALGAAVERTMHSGLVPLVVDSVLADRDVEVDPYGKREDIEREMYLLRSAFGDFSSHRLYEEDLDLIEGFLIGLDDPLGEFWPTRASPRVEASD